MGQDVSLYADNMPQLPHLHLLPQIQDFLPKLAKISKHNLKSENPTYLKFDDSPDPDSDLESDPDPEEEDTPKDQAVPYTLYRTRFGSPSLNRRSFTDEQIDRFVRENDGFPLPCSEEELKAFDEDLFSENQTARQRKKKDRQRSKSATNVPDLNTLRLKLQKIQSPSKPKFIEHLINRVSKKVGRDCNGLINPLPLDTADDPATDEILSPDSQKCLQVAESLAKELIACTHRPPSGESCDSGQGSSLLESTSDFSPTSKQQSWSTPTSPTFNGIVKQRLRSFQALRECSLPPVPLGRGSPRRPSCKENRELVETQLSAKKFHCALREDETFTKAVMESGYVKALVNRLNEKKNSDKDSEDRHHQDSRRVSADVVNGVKVCLKEETSDDWPDEFGGIDEKHEEKKPYKSQSVKNQLTKWESGSTKSDSSISSSNSWKKRSEKTPANINISKSKLNETDISHAKNLDKQESKLNGSVGAVSNSEPLTASGKPARTLSESNDQEEETEEEPKDRLHKIAYELLTTERAYVARLHLLDQVFHFKVALENKNDNFIPTEVVNQIFSHIKPIYQFHNDHLLPQVENRMKNWSQEQRIGDIMAKLAPFLKLYTEYVKNFENSMTFINKWTKQSPRFASLLQEIQKMPECGQLTLQHHMLEPIQRVPRYELLLKDYLKHLDPGSSDKAEAEKALGLVAEAALHSSEAMETLEKFDKMLTILPNIIGEGISDLVCPTRSLVKEGPITKISARSGEKQDRYLFLFNDLLLVCISQLMGKYKVRAKLSVDGMEVLPGENLTIQNTFCIKCTEKTVEFLDEANNGEGLDWLVTFENVITDYMNNSKLGLHRVASNKVLGVRVSVIEHQELNSDLGRRAPMWIKDEEVTMCMDCQVKFTPFRRRHHCRACGKIFCWRCSNRKVQLQYDNYKISRVCQKCHDVLKGDSIEEAPEETPNLPTPTNKAVTQIEADQSSVLYSYLNVMENGKNRTWNRRWITVRDDFVLYFYKKHKDVKATATMPLPGHTVKVIDGTEKLDKQHVFALSHKDVNVCYFQTETDEQLQRWTDVLKKMVLLQLPSEEDKRLSAHSLDSGNSTNSSTGS